MKSSLAGNQWQRVRPTASTVAALKAAIHDFVAARDWYQYHTPKNLAMCIG
ncbi:MAG: hypothetical protein R2867_42265 [Caldilineaceae bacterium]